MTPYLYNAADRLVGINDDGGPVARYRYDPQGRRIAKTVTEGSNSKTTFYLYGEEGLIAELDESGRTTKAYGWVPESLWGTAPLWQAEPQGGKTLADAGTVYRFLHTDHLGTPVLATDANGQVSWRGRAEAFGKTTPAWESTAVVDLRFPGQVFDSETGLHQNYFRDYNSVTGRYIQSDPIGLRGGVNTYAYVDGNPIDSSDFFGLVKHTTGQTKQCGNCTIRIDYVLDEKTGKITRHLHWDCGGKSGTFGENGESSHGGSCASAPKSVIACAKKHGFNCSPLPSDPVPVLPLPSPNGGDGDADPSKNTNCGQNCQQVQKTVFSTILMAFVTVMFFLCSN